MSLTKAKVKDLILNGSQADLEMVFIPLIMRNQTSQEVVVNHTVEQNGIGLNGCDAPAISYYFKKIRSGRHLSEEQIEKARVKLVKYAGQYCRIAEENQRQKQYCTA